MTYTDPTVRTRYGTVRGTTHGRIHSFKGIPYARPPFGPYRMRPPQRGTPWTAIRPAVDFGPTAPQPQFPLPANMDGFYPTIAGKDCLNLNVWSADLGGARQPVMVWLHGGGFDGGSSSIYDGSRFARDGVVFVSLNYRLGVEGFGDLGDGNVNLALLDQIAALHWVRENITAFGGDPDNVTIFGESSGAMSVGALLTMPAAHGLFQRAIMQSGAGNTTFAPETAQHIGRLLAAELGVPPTRDAIAAVEMERLLDAQNAVMAQLAPYPDPRRWNGEPGARVTAWQPVVDGQILPTRPIDAIRAGVGADVDILIGTNAEEGRLSLVPFGLLDAITDDDLLTAMKLYGLPVDRALAVYRASNPGAGPGDLLSLLQRDWWYRIPAYRLAEARAGIAAATYLYEFAWRSPQFDGLLGACHFLEVPFVFDLLDSPLFQKLTGTRPPQALAATMHASWIAFATHGDPGWAGYDLVKRPVMRFDTASRLGYDPQPAERSIWDGVY
ncbi:carboxylesterase/lipase family protein [Micromonospora polyrhachis]|uniref:Carboxylic ester hydrolase n=1 Tax=Micromonospora polyrhachis TaxID=1282883 RepID=A0A7W7SWQ1_9ACTN|nr:carboxylesterase family protein [Micromonospora polyrhachis]MBB4962331.1 para-nitrobenzyl esterase [Micromonospora polyrhachis]